MGFKVTAAAGAMAEAAGSGDGGTNMQCVKIIPEAAGGGGEGHNRGGGWRRQQKVVMGGTAAAGEMAEVTREEVAERGSGRILKATNGRILKKQPRFGAAAAFRCTFACCSWLHYDV